MLVGRERMIARDDHNQKSQPTTVSKALTWTDVSAVEAPAGPSSPSNQLYFRFTPASMSLRSTPSASGSSARLAVAQVLADVNREVALGRRGGAILDIDVITDEVLARRNPPLGEANG
jgi:hypothetical protein